MHKQVSYYKKAAMPSRADDEGECERQRGTLRVSVRADCGGWGGISQKTYSDGF